MKVDRRSFLKGTVLLAPALGTPSGLAAMGGEIPAPARSMPPAPWGDVIDANVDLFQWPFRRMRGDEPAVLVEWLRANGVVQAWAGSFEGIFHKNVAAVNERLAGACRAHGAGLLVPFGTVNPMLPAWEEDLRQCAEEHVMPGIRLHPGYHGYALDDPAFARVLDLAERHGLLVQVVPWMEDERHHNPLMPVPTTALAPLAPLVREREGLHVVILNGFRAPQGDGLEALAAADRVYIDIAKLDVLDGLGTLLERYPPERVLFGSHAPLFYIEASLLKMQEAGLTPAQIRRLAYENAAGLLAGV